MPVLLNVLLLSVTALAQFLQSKSKTSKKHPQPPKQPDGSHPNETLDPIPVRPFVTAYRGTMMIITCLAILAVDFKVFPRRFAKVETWGTSIMDMGVGSFVFAAGLVSARPIIKARLAGENSSIMLQLRASLRTSLPLVVLGLIRLYSVKGLDYAEHVTEYGIHWNFFFTMALLPPFAGLFQPLPNFLRCYILPNLIVTVYQQFLDHTRLKAYILTAPRSDLLSQNREGVFSFWGYLSIYLAGQAIGMDVLPRMPTLLNPTSSAYDRRYHLIKRLILWSVAQYALFSLSTGTRLGLRLHTSRRLANAPYVEWVIWYNSSQMLLFCSVETLLFPSVYTATEKETEKRQIQRATSKVLKAFNRNGLAIFLLANLLTGLVNMTLDTLHMGVKSSMAVLGGYAGLLTVIAVTLDAWNISIKL